MKITEMSTENSPLLSNDKDCNLHYGQLTEAAVGNHLTTNATIPPIRPGELPPPYTPSPHGVPMIACEICGFMIDIIGRWNQLVIQCNRCNEETPIKTAPPGKKYVRCQCNCLLVCKSSSRRIRCPRNNCKRIINLAPVEMLYPLNLPDMCQVSCAYCHTLFMFNTVALFDSCPHCHRVSCIWKKYSSALGKKWLIAAFMMLIVDIIIILARNSYNIDFGDVIIFVYIGIFVVSLLFFAKARYYFTMKANTIQGTMS